MCTQMTRQCAGVGLAAGAASRVIPGRGLRLALAPLLLAQLVMSVERIPDNSSRWCRSHPGCRSLADTWGPLSYCCPDWRSEQLGCCNTSTPAATPPPSVPLESEYDAIVVGAGLMGSAVAAKLAENLPQEYRILVLEAGKASHHSLGGDEPPATMQQWSGQWQDWVPRLRNLTRYDVPANYQVLPCWGSNCEQAWREVPAFQCKVLGGCGVMNGALTQVPHPESFDSWPAGWQWGDLEPYFQAARDIFHITQTPSADGRHHLDDAGANFVRSALASHFVEMVPLQPASGGMGVPFVTADGGVRQSTASVMLPGALARPNFQLLLESLVTQIEHDGSGRATGVRYIRGGQSQVARLSHRGLAVLAGGALNTPRLLLQSGAVPGNSDVGRGVSDHTYASQTFSVPPGSVAMTFPHPPSTASIREYAENRTGGLTQFGPLLTAFWRSPHSDGYPWDYDVEVWVQPSTETSRVTLHFCLMRPTCSSADVVLGGTGVVFQNAGLHTACQHDRDLLEGARQAMEGWMREAGATVLGGMEGPHPMNHWVGSCALEVCADPTTLLVHRSANIAVADASIIPHQVWGHPALTMQAVALKAAEVISDRLRR